MDMNNTDLQKSLVALIDETLNEIEELKKSKFSADEIKIEGAGSNELAGKPVNGKLDAAKAESKEHEEKESKEHEEKESKSEEKKEEAKKAEDKDEESEEEKKKKMEKGVLDEAEKKQVVKAEDKDEDKKEDKKEDKEEKKEFPFKKSLEDQEALIKSYVDSKISGFEAKMNQLTDMVAKLADQPVERKGVAAGQVVPLKKSNDVAILSKSEVANKLFELKKSGAKVDTSDIIRAETGSDNDLKGIVSKYELR